MILFLSSYLFSIAPKDNFGNAMAFCIMVILTLVLIGFFGAAFIFFRWPFDVVYGLALLPLGFYGLHYFECFVVKNKAIIERRNQLLRHPVLGAVGLLVGSWVLFAVLLLGASALRGT